MIGNIVRSNPTSSTSTLADCVERSERNAEHEDIANREDAMNSINQGAAYRVYFNGRDQTLPRTMPTIGADFEILPLYVYVIM